MANSGNVTLTIPAVVTTPVRISEAAPSFGKYKAWTTTFKIDPEVWQAALTASHVTNLWPKSRDYLMDGDGNIWLVSRDTAGTHQGNPYRLACNRLTFSTPLKDTVTIYTAVNTIDSYLGPHVNQTGVLASGLAAAVQPVEPQLIEPGKFQGKQGFRKEFIVYIATPLVNYVPTLYQVDYGYLVKDQNAVVYSVESWKNPQRIDMLQELHVRQNP